MSKSKESTGDLFESVRLLSDEGAEPDVGKYITDPADNLRAEIVKRHAQHKYDLLRRYVDICSAVRNKFHMRSYIDLYCGPGRARIGLQGEFVDSSPVVAWKTSCKIKRTSASRFTDVYIADIDTENVKAADARLKALGANVHRYAGDAANTVDDVLAALPGNGFHFAFLDPYNLRTLPFVVVEKLAAYPALDILLHFSVMDLRRNLRRFVKGDLSYLDAFAPGWQQNIDSTASDDLVFKQVEAHWKALAAKNGKPARGVELITGPTGQHLYWLILLSKSDLAERFFSSVSTVGRQRMLFGTV